MPRAQSRRTEPYWEPGEVEEEGVARGGVVALLLVRWVGQAAGHQWMAWQDNDPPPNVERRRRIG